MNTTHCVTLYKDFLDKKITLEELQSEGCYPKGSFEVKPMLNPANSFEPCQVIFQRKNYYNQTYDPQSILDVVDGFSERGREFYRKEFEYLFDLEVRKNCCNCIAITLYANIEKLQSGAGRFPVEGYLTAMRRSVKNIAKMLPDWLVRLYIDSSVFNYARSSGNKKEQEILDYLLGCENVEVHTILCQELMRSDTIDKTRVYRFIPLFDKTVNVAVIREADGIVTNLDCHNIRVFQNSNKLFYLAQISLQADYEQEMQIWNAYSSWLQYYKFMMNREYFVRNHNAVTFLAGTLAVKLRVKEGVFRYTMEQVSKMIDAQQNFTPKQIELEFRSNERETGITTGIYNLYKKLFSSPVELVKMLKVGFDEIFLLHLFRNLACVDIGDIITFDDNGKTNTRNFSAYISDADPMYETFFNEMFYSVLLNSKKAKKRVVTTLADFEELKITSFNKVLLEQFLEAQKTVTGRQFVIDAALTTVSADEIIPVNITLLNEAYYKYSEMLDPVYDIFHELM